MSVYGPLITSPPTKKKLNIILDNQQIISDDQPQLNFGELMLLKAKGQNRMSKIKSNEKNGTGSNSATFESNKCKVATKTENDQTIEIT